MPVPRGFLEINVASEAMGPFRELYPQGAAQLNYPVFGRYLLYWGDPGAPVPTRVLEYPHSILYGGPAPFSWVSKDLPGFVRQWAATLPPKEGGGAGTWLVVAMPVGFLVPPEALPFPYKDFRWNWFLESEPPAQYSLEGNKLAPLFRNLTTHLLDLPPPLGPGPTAIAGDLLGGLLDALGWELPELGATKPSAYYRLHFWNMATDDEYFTTWKWQTEATAKSELAAQKKKGRKNWWISLQRYDYGVGYRQIAGTLEDEDEIDPPAQTWLTPEEAALEAGLTVLPPGTEEVPGPVPHHVEENIGEATEEILGATPGAWVIKDVWNNYEYGKWRLKSRSQPEWSSRAAAQSWKMGQDAVWFGDTSHAGDWAYAWVWNGSSWEQL